MGLLKNPGEQADLSSSGNKYEVFVILVENMRGMHRVIPCCCRREGNNVGRVYWHFGRDGSR